MLAVSNLSHPGLAPASFELGKGERVVLQGPSGSGKTLLLRALADLDPTEGRVALEGEDRESMSGPQWRRRVVYLPAEPGWWADVPEEHFTATTASLEPQLQRLGLSRDIMMRPVRLLSTGERQRLALLRALALNPEVLLLDEPTAALDQEATLAVEQLIGACAATVIWSSHDRAQAKRVAARRFLMSDGHFSEAA